MRETTRRWVLFGTALAWLAGAGTGACTHRTPHAQPEAPLALVVLPRLGLAPRDVSVTARIDRNPANREACLVFVNEDQQDVVKSCHSLDGVNAPRFWQHLFEHIDAGAYAVVLLVRQADGTVRRLAVSACYAGEFVSCGSPGVERAS